MQTKNRVKIVVACFEKFNKTTNNHDVETEKRPFSQHEKTEQL